MLDCDKAFAGKGRPSYGGTAHTGLVHPYSPCLLKGGAPREHRSMRELAAEILRKDKERVQTILSRNRLAHDGERSLATSSSTSARTNASYESSEYIAKVGIGTPASYFLLLMDTGSSLTWTQCFPCENATACFPQPTPLFDPSTSSSYSAIPCGSQEFCADCSPDGFCMFSETYGDGSTAVGDYANETLTIGDAAIQNFMIGCAHAGHGIFDNVDGIIGLGWDIEGMPSQSSSFFQGAFAYCLPAILSSTTSAGFIEFGIDDNSNATADFFYTPMIKNTNHPSYYYVWLTGIRVDGAPLPLASISPTRPTPTDIGGTIIDSGTALTHLPEVDYNTVRDAFVTASSNITIASPPTDSGYDTCFQVNDDSVIPFVEIQFEGFSFTLTHDNTLKYFGQVVCLAFVAEPTGNLIIIGNFQLNGYLFMFDTIGERLGIHSSGKLC
ncbi:hypothetical protein KP509_38G023300 [Ceratopteris richardii]|uniref:Peptidase A1 domain-containing protein n=1 Tax=Ceratopteris richardii TaxID=49495 RepID=A0A8T2Q339_CERRI|nr:hypothetical protein KP509_38G023300 [Ceratopteris richardii]